MFELVSSTLNRFFHGLIFQISDSVSVMALGLVDFAIPFLESPCPSIQDAKANSRATFH